jgi:hypothetical protein
VKNTEAPFVVTGRKMTTYVDKEPVFFVLTVSASKRKVAPTRPWARKSEASLREPLARAGFEHEEGNHLPDEQTDNFGLPLDGGPVSPRNQAENDSHYRDGAIAA